MDPVWHTVVLVCLTSRLLSSLGLVRAIFTSSAVWMMMLPILTFLDIVVRIPRVMLYVPVRLRMLLSIMRTLLLLR